MINPYVGEVTCFGFDWAPQGWIKCEGQLLSVQKFNQLFSVVGTAFGAPGRMIYLCAASRRLPRAVNGVSGGRLGHPNNKSRPGDPRNGSPKDVFGSLGWSLGPAKADVLRAL